MSIKRFILSQVKINKAFLVLEVLYYKHASNQTIDLFK